MRLFDELKRRNVFRVGVAYVLLGWLVIQVTDTVAPALGLPDWTLTFVTWIGIIGFPIAVFLAWAFELTPDGIKAEKDVEQSASSTKATGRQLNFAIIALLLVAIGFMAWNGSVREPGSESARLGTTSATSGGESGASIAVLPLTNLSSISENAFFAAGVHEEILTNLSRIDGLRVVSRTTALRYLDSDLSLRDIGRELGVRYIVEGSVRRINEHVRITVQLIDALDDVHLWASNYDRELVDVFATQSQVANVIANSIHLEVQPDTVGVLDDMPTHSVRAYDLYMKAVSLERSEPESESALKRQRALLEASVEEDPDFAEAWAFLNETLDHIARLILQQNWFGETQVARDNAFREVREAAQRSLDRAIALDPENLATLLAQASDYVLEQESPEYREERREFIDRAIELYPDSAFPWYVLAWWQRLDGDWAAATVSFQKALELDPLHARIVEGSLIHFRTLGDQEMTTLLFERLAQIAPEKGEDPRLAEITASAKMDNLLVAFIDTADESLIERYAEVFDENRGRFLFGSLELLHEALVLELQNDIDGLLDLEVDGALPDEPAVDLIPAFVFALYEKLSAEQLAGHDARAEGTARRILSVTQLPADRTRPDWFDILDAPARLVVTPTADLSSTRERLVSNEQVFGNDLYMPRFWVLTKFDLDDAVRQLLETKAKQPGWFGTDVVAAFHVRFRDVVTHPDMRAFYAEEGKWVDYLEARVPGYSSKAQ